MDKIKILNEIKEIYNNGGNIIAYLKQKEERQKNSLEDILISYDFQAGTYCSNYEKEKELMVRYHKKIAEILNLYISDRDKVLEAGVGEATTLGPVMKILGLERFEEIYGFDISWSRIKYAEKFLKSLLGNVEKFKLFCADLCEIPAKDNSIDVVYTVHAIEPNGGREKEILQELYRIASKYLILIEPAYEFADEKAKRRMEENGYIKDLYDSVISLGYKVLDYRLLGVNLNVSNPSGVMIIKKEVGKRETEVLCDPVSKKELIIENNIAYCESSMLAYPIVLDVPMLIKNNAIVATKYKDFC